MKIEEIRGRRSHYWNAVIPGIRAISESKGYAFHWDGFLPAIKKESEIKRIDMGFVESCIADEDYGKIEGHIKSLCEE